MNSKNLIKSIFFILFSLIVFSCSNKKENNKSAETSNISAETQSTQRFSTTEEDYHTNSDYKYEHRTGTSGDYEYNYNVNGSDDDGNSINGNVDMNGKYGTGTIEDEKGNEKNIDVEWNGYGRMEATDEDGNTYELETD
ncbi:hypothetical protein ACM55I_15255 [Flavobacterium sp. GB2R13]|uniref:hypothetical protein n=1 Tax=Flavobacterium algoris TaxID=3398733 RepID=UPI003A85360C